MNVHLISMPWASIEVPSLALGTLTALADEGGFKCVSTEASWSLADDIGLDFYQMLASDSKLFGLSEHLFAVDCFGAERLRSEEWLQRLGFRGETLTELRRLSEALLPTWLDKITARVLQTAPQVIGLTCTFNQTMASLAIARRIKTIRRESVIVLGGACVHDVMGQEIARAFHHWIDYVFTGEADTTFIPFLQSVHDGKEPATVPGIATASCRGERAPVTRALDAVPIPRFDHYFSEFKAFPGLASRVQVKGVPFESSRGCWWGAKSHCTFCGLNGSGMAYRKKSTRRVSEELAIQEERYGMTAFLAADNILPADAYRDLLPALERDERRRTMFYEIKANVRRDDVRALARAGVESVQPGIESFSDGMLVRMRKGVCGLQNVQLLKWCDEFDIRPLYNILCGFPGETVGELEELVRVMTAITHLPPPSGVSSVVEVHRFSPFFNDGAALGIKGLRPAAHYAHLFPEGAVALSEVAYFFDRDFDATAPYHAMRGAIDQCILGWSGRGTRMRAALLEGEICVSVWRGSDEVVHGIVRGLSALVLVELDTVTSLSRLVASVSARLDVSERDVRDAVAGLLDDGLVLMANGRAVGLVPIAGGLAEADLERWKDACFPAKVGRAT